MKRSVYILLLCACSVLPAAAQPQNTWGKWQPFLGKWQHISPGQSGQSSGSFSLELQLDQKILVRKSRAEFQPSANKPKEVQEDMTVVYLDDAGIPSKATYFDNQGHHINYIIRYVDNSIIFLSERVPDMPSFRLTYTMRDKLMHTKVELSKDGMQYITYIEADSKKLP